jgi:BirA family biotin operon repressor/biotin-[acetyl-CoA-carboxylase] ligase
MDEPLVSSRMIRPGSILGHRIVLNKETASTNDDAHNLARNGAPPGTVVMTELQTKGRGRLKRSWHSPGGKDLLFSVILDPAAARQGPGLFTLAAGVAVARAVSDYGIQAALKWPNDVRVRGRKLSGILCEAGGRTGMDYLVAGIGINVNLTKEEIPPELADTATSMYIETGREPDRAYVLKNVLACLEREVELIVSGRQDRVLDAWMELFESSGKMVKAQTPSGDIEGRASGVRADGALLVMTESGEQAVMAGDVVPA